MTSPADSPTSEPEPTSWLPSLVVAALVVLLLAGGIALYFRSQAADALPFDYQGFDKK